MVTLKIYKDSTVKKIVDALPKCREVFLKEYAHAIKDYRCSMLYPSHRFNCDRRIVQSLESNVKEEDLLKELNYYIDSALKGAAECDYYYRFEKEW